MGEMGEAWILGNISLEGQLPLEICSRKQVMEEWKQQKSLVIKKMKKNKTKYLMLIASFK